jgi:GrpB-like predicted nucleotidyltransferase (UPF0157 family)
MKKLNQMQVFILLDWLEKERDEQSSYARGHYELKEFEHGDKCKAMALAYQKVMDKVLEVAR